MSAGKCGNCRSSADTMPLTADEIQCVACGKVSKWAWRLANESAPVAATAEEVSE